MCYRVKPSTCFFPQIGRYGNKGGGWGWAGDQITPWRVQSPWPWLRPNFLCESEGEWEPELLGPGACPVLCVCVCVCKCMRIYVCVYFSLWFRFGSGSNYVGQMCKYGKQDLWNISDTQFLKINLLLTSIVYMLLLISDQCKLWRRLLVFIVLPCSYLQMAPGSFGILRIEKLTQNLWFHWFKIKVQIKNGKKKKKNGYKATTTSLFVTNTTANSFLFIFPLFQWPFFVLCTVTLS